MGILTTPRERATALIVLLGLALLWAILPFLTGLIGGLVLFVLFDPLHRTLVRHIRPAFSAAVVAALAFLVLVAPTVSLAGLLVDQAQLIATDIASGPFLERVSQLRIGGFDVGPRIAGLSEQLVSWLGSSALSLIGTATRLGLNLTIALFVVYYLLLRPEQTWAAVRPYIPFSPENADRLRGRFADVTVSTIIGTGLIAAIQGLLVAGAFWITGLGHPGFWGVITAVFSILPVVGAGLVWAPGAVVLALEGRYGAAIFLVLVGAVLVANVDVLIRPAVYRRYAQIHPLVTLVGAIAGVRYFGLLGILIGPLTLSYFFELLQMHREEYLADAPTAS